MKRTRDFSFNNQQFKINISPNHLFVLSDITIVHKKTWETNNSVTDHPSQFETKLTDVNVSSFFHVFTKNSEH